MNSLRNYWKLNSAMSIDFNKTDCHSYSNKKIFGLCDNPHPAKDPAYINDSNEAIWIAKVINRNLKSVTFTAIDHCIDLIRADGKMSKRCDGMMTFDETVIFVELKDSNVTGNEWIKQGELQLKASIEFFEITEKARAFTTKKAYISNKARPRFRSSQQVRMDRFQVDTGYILSIGQEIKLEN
jgi:hypothetical protein